MKQNVIYIATENKSKIKEFKEILKEYDVKSLYDLPNKLDIVENGNTFEQNALIKAKTLANYINGPAIGDDSGIEVVGLNNFPGIYSKRWALPLTDYKDINNKLLEKMKEANLITPEQRKARFTTVIAYYNPITKEEHFFKGIINGTIADRQMGENVFGYDPLFIPTGQTKTFSQLGEKKNDFSHRRIAIDKFVSYLNKQNRKKEN